MTLTDLLLLDSAGVKLMRQSSCHIGTRNAEGTHVIRTVSIIRVDAIAGDK